MLSLQHTTTAAGNGYSIPHTGRIKWCATKSLTPSHSLFLCSVIHLVLIFFSVFFSASWDVYPITRLPAPPSVPVHSSVPVEPVHRWWWSLRSGSISCCWWHCGSSSSSAAPPLRRTQSRSARRSSDTACLCHCQGHLLGEGEKPLSAMSRSGLLAGLCYTYTQNWLLSLSRSLTAMGTIWEH